MAKKAAKKTTRKSTPAQPTEKLSALSAAEHVLKTAGVPMNTKELIAAMEEQGLWKSPGGNTPHATLYSAIIREIAAKKSTARFRRVSKGHFVAH